jgi:beta-fructofuranosidase
MQAEIEKAMNAIGKAQQKAGCDPLRPQFHFCPPANWLNDPNGPIVFKGLYHLFYQHNPYKARWGSIHWGHTTSPDLVHWQHQPIALAPSKEEGENHCFSGCCVDNNGTPTIIYTSIRKLTDVIHGARQCGAWALDANLVRWEKFPENPIMTDFLHEGMKVRHWRDPFVWHDKNTEEPWHCVLGCELLSPKRGAVLHYSSANLIQWQYRGVLCEGDGATGQIWECPLFFPLGDHWVLIVSPMGRVMYNIGDFDGKNFFPTEWRVLDHGQPFYAPNSFQDLQGRHILIGWIRGGGKGSWNGCFSIPRVLSLQGSGKDQRLAMAPIPELKQLRFNPWKMSNTVVKSGEDLPLPQVGSGCYEIEIQIHALLVGKCGIRIKDGLKKGKDAFIGIHSESLSLQCGKEFANLHINGIGLEKKWQAPLRLHIFIDRSAVELSVNGIDWITGKIAPIGLPKLDIALVCEPSDLEVLEVSLWEIKSIW